MSFDVDLSGSSGKNYLKEHISSSSELVIPGKHYKVDFSQIMGAENYIPNDVNLFKKIDNHIRKIDKKFGLELSEDKINFAAAALLFNGKHSLELAKKQNTKILFDAFIPEVAFVTTEKGTYHIGVAKVGSGEFKDTFQFVKLGRIDDLITGTIQDKLKFTAVGKPRQNKKNEKQNEFVLEQDNEIALHRTLRTAQKPTTDGTSPNPVSHIAVSKVISHFKMGQSSPGLVLMSKFFNGGDVDKRLIQDNLSMVDRAFICAEFLQGTAQLHRLNILHRDIKSDNLLMEVQVKIVPKNEWPVDISVDKCPPGYEVEHVNGVITAVKSIKIVRVALGDLGKGTHLDPQKRFTQPVSLYNAISPPGLGDDSVLFSKKFDIYAAGRTAYQIFAGVPLKDLKAVNTNSLERGLIQSELAVVLNEIKAEKDEFQLNQLKAKLQHLEQKLVDWDVRSLGFPETWTNWHKIPVKVQEFIKKMVEANPEKRPSAEECSAFFYGLQVEDLKIPEVVPVLVPDEVDLQPVYQNMQGGYA